MLEQARLRKETVVPVDANRLDRALDALMHEAPADAEALLLAAERIARLEFQLQAANFVQCDHNGWHDRIGLEPLGRKDLDCILQTVAGPARRGHQSCADRAFYPLSAALSAPLSAHEAGLLLVFDEEAPPPVQDIRIFLRFVETLLKGLSMGRVSQLRLDLTTAFKRVANTILKSKDLPEIFFNITQVGQAELSADICGIMLLEDDWLVMQRCVGNQSPDTSKLRMRAGQGVGGRVLETAAPCAVENYVQSATISRDFFDLARAENVRSALAVPLFSNQKIIGVLEVWRRRPSTFSVENTAELSALADLASVAIENANLIAAQRDAVSELQVAHATMIERYDIIESAVEFQAELVNVVLQNHGLDKIAALASDYLSSPVLVLDQNLHVRASAGPFEVAARDVEKISHELLKIPLQKMDQATLRIHSDLDVTCQRISAVTGQLGWVVVVNLAKADERARLALASTSITVALFRMKERAAASALSEKSSALLWDLIEAPETVRQLALQRLRDAQFDIQVPTFLMLCRFEAKGGQTKPADQETHEENFRRRLNYEFAGNLQNAQSPIRLLSFRSKEIVAVLSPDQTGRVAEFAARFKADVEKAIPGAKCSIGISSRCDDPLALPTALKEARLALTIAQNTAANMPVEYDNMGLLGIMLGLREGAGFRDFVGRTLGELVEPSQQASALRQTLKAYFDTNCNQNLTAKELRIHPKTVAYRLEKIEEATRLDLKSHECRVLLSIALQLRDYGIEDLGL